MCLYKKHTKPTMTPKDLDKLISKYLEGKCTPDEVDFIESLYSSLGSSAELKDKDVAFKTSSAENRMLAKLRRHTGASSAIPTVQRSLSWYYIGIAASLLIGVALVYYKFSTPDSPVPIAMDQTAPDKFTYTENLTDEPKRVILPDGSIVVMLGESRIRFSNGAETISRELFLEGEAYFDIAHDATRPFYVYAGNFITRVVGTTFTVSNRQNEKVTVSVKTGKVTVYSQKAIHKKTVLTPNHEAVYDHATDIVETQQVPQKNLQQEDSNLIEMHFEETPVPQVLEMLTKTYSINIQFDKESLAGCVLTSSFYEEGLYDRIDVICTAIGATYKIVDTQIVVESNGCNLKPNEP